MNGKLLLAMHIIIGILIAAFGFLMVWKTVSFFDIMGRIDWAEEKLGPGGTTTFLKILGVVFIFIGFTVLTNMHVAVLEGFAGLFVRK